MPWKRVEPCCCILKAHCLDPLVTAEKLKATSYIIIHTRKKKPTAQIMHTRNLIHVSHMTLHVMYVCTL